MKSPLARFMALALVFGVLLEQDSARAGGKGTVVTLGELTSTTPADWKSMPVSSKLRLHTFAVGDADLAIFFFGEGSGGDVKSNLKRWKDMFQAPEGKTIDDIAKVETFKVGDKAEVTYLDVTGTFLSKNPPFDPNAKLERKTNYRRFGVIFATKGGPYFITMTGPAKTLDQHKKGFDEWLKNFK